VVQLVVFLVLLIASFLFLFAFRDTLDACSLTPRILPRLPKRLCVGFTAMTLSYNTNNNIMNINMHNINTNIIDTKESWFLVPLVWDAPEVARFDNLASALLTMYRALNNNNTPHIADALMWAPHSEADDPSAEPKVEFALPLTAFLLLNLVLVQVFTVVLINALEVTRGRAFMTSPQRTLEATNRLILAVSSPHPHNNPTPHSEPQPLTLHPKMYLKLETGNPNPETRN
jgi:hypothetical protein